MAEPSSPVENDAIDKRSDVDNKPRSSRFWLGEVAAAQKRDKSWRGRGNKVVARYRDERDMDRDSAKGERRANILWSNTEILKSALFQGLGNPDVRRRFAKKGRDGRAARQAALVLERSLTTCGESSDTEAQIEASIEDMLLPGRGTAWIVYEAEVSKPEQEEPAGGQDDPEGTSANHSMTMTASPQASPFNGLLNGAGQPQVVEEITSQSVRIDHVYWEDYLCSAGRKDSDVWWKARGHDYSRDELKQYWPDHADKIPLDVRVGGFDARKAKSQDDEDTFKRARVWEIWDKSKKQRVFVAEGYDAELDRAPDPYQLKAFFPTVTPLYGVKTTSSLTPIPEYTLYQDQAEELDLITTRLSRLINNLKRRGVYDASAEGPDNQLSALAHAGDDQFLPYRNFAVLMEKGGLKNVFQTEDLVPTIQVVEKLYEQRAALVQTIYEITGISDVIRGASNPNETATAQRIKGQFGSLRLQKRQKQVQTFIRDLYRLKAEIMAEHFTREQLQDMSGVDLPTQAEIAQAKQQLTAIQNQFQASQQSQQAMQAYQQQVSGAGGQGSGGPMNGAAPPNGMMPGMGMPQPPQVIPPPQIDPEQMQALFATSTAISWEEVAAILRSDQKRGYKVDIETEATAQVDNEAEKASRIEFLSTMQGFLERIIPATMQQPALAPLAKELVMFAVGAFKVGRTLEETFDDAFEQIQQAAQQASQNGPPPDPVAEAKAEQIKTQTEATKAQAAADQQMAQADLMARSAKAQADQMKTQAEMQHDAMEREAKAQERAADFGIKQQESHAKVADMAAMSQMAQQKTHADISIAQLKAHAELQSAWAKFQAEMAKGQHESQMQQAEHQQKMFNTQDEHRRKAAQPFIGGNGERH